MPSPADSADPVLADTVLANTAQANNGAPPAQAAAVGVPDGGRRAAAVLHRVFGFESFRGRQEDIISHVIGGGDALVEPETASCAIPVAPGNAPTAGRPGPGSPTGHANTRVRIGAGP